MVRAYRKVGNTVVNRIDDDLSRRNDTSAENNAMRIVCPKCNRDCHRNEPSLTRE